MKDKFAGNGARPEGIESGSQDGIPRLQPADSQAIVLASRVQDAGRSLSDRWILHAMGERRVQVRRVKKLRAF